MIVMCWVITWDTKVVISLAVGGFLKWEFDTMVLSMSKRVSRTPKAPRFIKIEGLKELRRVTKVEHPSNRALLTVSPSGALVET